MHPLNKVKSNKISLDNVPKYIEYSDEDLNSSYLSVVYKVKDYDTKEMETYNAINEVLNDVGYLLRKVLRDERQLVYYAYSSFLSKSGIFEINTNITKENAEATIEAIDEVFKRLEDPVLVEELLKIGKREVKRSYYVEDESYSKVFGRMIDEGFRFSKPKKNSTRKYMALKKEDIAKALKKLEKVTVYIYRGEKQ